MSSESSSDGPLTEAQIHSIIGSDGIEKLVKAFYQQVPDDDVLGPMYPPDDLPGAEQRLRMFLIFRLGGPQDYLQHRGHPRLRLRHAPFAVDQRARDRWVLLMDNAIRACDLPDDVRPVLRDFLSGVATFLINR